MFKNKREEIKRKIIKEQNLNSIEDTINYIKKIVVKMTKEQLDGIENHLLKKPKSEATDLWLKIIDDRQKEIK